MQSFNKSFLFFYLVVFTFFYATTSFSQIQNPQVDNFNDGTVQNWERGVSNPDIISNQANRLQVKATGGTGNGITFSKLIVFNNNQWAGDYIAAGVTAIKMKLRNVESNKTLRMRLAIGDTPKPGNDPQNPTGTWFVTKEVFQLTSGSEAIEVVFSLTEDMMQLAQTPDPGTNPDRYTNVLSNVASLRIINSTSSFNPRGDDNTIATLLVDDITACGCPATPVDETVDGDLSDNHLLPTPIQISENAATIATCQQGDPRDIDYFTFTVPENKTLSAINLTNYAASNAPVNNLAFIGIQAGSSFSFPATAPSVSDLLGGLTYGEGNEGTNILPSMGMLNGSQGFTPPLAAGDYSIWLNQTGPQSCATFELIFSDPITCMETSTFENETIATGEYQATTSIATNETVNIAANSTVTFQAGTSIMLNPTFTVPVGSDFTAQIGACTNTPSIMPSILPFQKEVKTAFTIAKPILTVYPNPFQTSTTIDFSLEKSQSVQLAVYNITGSIVKKIIQQEVLSKGSHSFDLFKGQLPAGSYFVNLRTQQGSFTRKVVILDNF